MATYVALLRGISPLNPNMRNEHLRAVHETLGFAHVRTVITTGNVVFDAPRTPTAELARRIERAIEQELEFHSATFVRSAAQIRELVEHDPLGGRSGDDALRNVTFVEGLVPVGDLAVEEPGVQDLAVARGYVCSLTTPGSVGERRLIQRIDRATTKRATMRTWNTVLRVRAAIDQTSS